MKTIDQGLVGWLFFAFVSGQARRLPHVIGRVVACWLLLAASLASAANPLYLQPPFDEIVLDDANAGAVLRVQPLDFPGRRMPSPNDRKDDLEFELLDRPGQKFSVPWLNIVEIRFFEQLVLAEADEQVKDGRYDDAQQYFLFLEAKYPQTLGLAESIEKFLYVQVGAAFRAQRYDNALALLVELYARNPQMKGVSTAYERVTSELVKQHLAAGNYAAARGLLKNLGERYPATKTTVVATYEAQLQGDAQKLVADAQAALAAGKKRDALDASLKALGYWPQAAGAKELAQSLHQEYPVVKVGVVSPLGGPPSRRIDQWAAVRTSVLVGRRLAEPAGAANAEQEGPAYQSPLGELSRRESPQQLVFKINPELRWSEPPRPVTPADVTQVLLRAADRQDPQYDPSWANAVGSVQAKDTEVLIELGRPHPSPEALFTMSLAGPYRPANQTQQESRFVRNAGDYAPVPGQPAEIEERLYPDSAAALAALRRGEISLVDRLSPWEVPQAAGDEIQVRRYKLPTVHVLVVNLARPLLRQREMRRALLYGIDRQSILRRGLLGGQELAGCELISGPFPRPAAKDASATAYNTAIEPRPYEPGTALVLARLAGDAALGTGKPLPPLVLAHPPGPIARVACQSIARQLQQLNLEVTLRDAAAGGEYDLLYAELVIREPVIDAWRVLGPQGVADACSPAMLGALRDVEAAPSLQAAAARLQTVHRLAASELPVIPLWQLAEHLAFHTSVQGVPEQPESLYDEVQTWRTELRVPAE